jgi:hypothetical protein
MRTLIAVFLLIALLFVASEARRAVFRTKRCVQKENVTCKYAKRCVKGAVRCVQRQTQRTCAKRAIRTSYVRKQVRTCVKFEKAPGTRTAATVCLRCAQWGTRTARKAVKRAVCVRHHTKRICLKRKRVCIKTKAVQRCYAIKNKYGLHGPKACPAGQYLVFRKRGRAIYRSCRAGDRSNVPMKTCTSYLDPHNTMIDGKAVEWQYVGDFVMAQTDDGVFAVHQRLTRFATTWTGTTGMAIMVNGLDVFEYLVGNHATLNGKPMNLVDGNVVNFPQGGSVKKAGQTVSVFSPNGAHVDFVDYGPYANIAVYIPSDIGIKGYCTDKQNAYWQKTPAKGLFNFRQKAKFLPGAIQERQFTAEQKEKAKADCVAAGFEAGTVTFKNCVLDALFTRRHPNMRKVFFRIEKNWKGRVARGLKRRAHF